ncbi:MAG: cyclic nucleotide-binding domain-containing protein [Nitrospiraceae bacterium]|nr:cyclic nucleotide-binding domain-containing protein [Nitrospiraceae bacterium]
MSKNLWEVYFNSIKNQDWEKGLTALNSILKKEPKNPQVHLKIGDIFQKADDMNNAIAAYHQAGWLFMKEGFLQKALAIYKIILRLDPNNSEAVNKTKNLMMELESSKSKTSAIPSLASGIETFSEAKEAEQKLEPEISQTEYSQAEQSQDNEINIEPVFTGNMEDLIERTSLEKPSFEENKLQKDEIPVQVPAFMEVIPRKEIIQIFKKIQPTTYLANETIIEEGDTGDSVYILKSGHANVVAHILGKEIQLAKLSPGDAFGEVAFLTGRPRTASVIAAERLEVLELNRVALEEIFDKYPDSLRKLEDFYYSRVKDTVEKVKKIKK